MAMAIFAWLLPLGLTPQIKNIYAAYFANT